MPFLYQPSTGESREAAVSAAEAGATPAAQSASRAIRAGEGGELQKLFIFGQIAGSRRATLPVSEVHTSAIHIPLSRNKSASVLPSRRAAGWIHVTG